MFTISTFLVSVFYSTAFSDSNTDDFDSYYSDEWVDVIKIVIMVHSKFSSEIILMLH